MSGEAWALGHAIYHAAAHAARLGQRVVAMQLGELGAHLFATYPPNLAEVERLARTLTTIQRTRAEGDPLIEQLEQVLAECRELAGALR